MSDNQYYNQCDSNYTESDDLTRPMTFGEYFTMCLWLLIPVVGVIFTIIWAIGGDGINLNKINFWRAYCGLYTVLYLFYIL